MSEDVPIFRSDAPHQVAVPQVGGDAVSPQASQGEPGESRKIVDNLVFAPLDDPKSLSEIEVASDPAAHSIPSAEATLGAIAAEPGLISSEPETADDRARRIRRLSPDLLDRAEVLRAEIDVTAAIVDGVIASFADFNPDALGLPDSSVAQDVLPDAAEAAKEPA